MAAWLTHAWAQIWPNLAASVIWAAPTFVTHHVLLRWHLRRIVTTLTKKEDA